MPLTPVLGMRRGDRRTAEVCWPASLAKSASSRLSERDRLKS